MGQDNAELVAEAREWAFINAVADRSEADVLRRLADALERVTPREVTTVAELEALPSGTAIRWADRLGNLSVSEKFNFGGWFAAGDDREFSSAEIPLPATVLFTPTGKENEHGN